jgi:nicotinamide-nucleotide adenylyltransferase
MPTRGLYVGRFQPFHLGHIGAIKNVLEEVEEIVVVIGSAQYSHTTNNPFTAGERLVMIRNALEEAQVDYARVWVVPVPDVHLHMMWVSAVEGYTPKFHVVYSNEPLTRRLFREAGYIVREKMLIGDSWKPLVPTGVSDFIAEIDGVNRLRELSRTDKV